MNTQEWIHYFESNAGTYREPDWSTPCTITDPVAREALAASLATFQLGESGGGTRIMGFARRLTNPGQFPEYERAVNLFINEEHYHAGLLARLVHHLGGELIQKNWTNSIFRGVRSLINLEFNIQVLLTAELIAEAYYGLLYRHARDPAVVSACHKILRDEVKHIAFHLDFFGSRFRCFSAIRRALWTAQFRFLFRASACVVWIDHRPCFDALGISRANFFDTAGASFDHFLNRLQRRLAWKSPTASEALGLHPPA